MKTAYAAAALVVLFALTACTRTGAAPGADRPADELLEDLSGMYAGQLPCADCAGILRRLTLFPNGMAAGTSLYDDGKGTTFTERGTWALHDGLIEVRYGKEREYYQRTGPGVLALVDENGQGSSAMPDLFLLRKIRPSTAEMFAGRYTALKKDVHGQALDIRARSATKVDVTVICGKAARGRAFTQESAVINDQIELPLRDRRAPGAVMVIRPGAETDVLVLSTTRQEDVDALAPLCGGISPAGRYRKTRQQD